LYRSETLKEPCVEEEDEVAIGKHSESSIGLVVDFLNDNGIFTNGNRECTNEFEELGKQDIVPHSWGIHSYLIEKGPVGVS
jgi:hypothetical protein